MEPLKTLELFRPVSGAEQLSAVTRQAAIDIFGETEVDVFPQATDEEFVVDGMRIPLVRLVTAGHPLATVLRPEELEFKHVQLSSPRDLHGSFGWAARRLIARAERIAFPVKRDGAEHIKWRTSPLYSSLDRIGIEYGVADQNEVKIECTAVETPVDMGADGHELWLTLNPFAKTTQMLAEQSRMCLRGMAGHSKKHVYPVSPSPNGIHFATMPRVVSERQGKEFQKRLAKCFPLQLVLGGVQSRILE